MLDGSNIGVDAYCFHELECGFCREHSCLWDFGVILKLQQRPVECDAIESLLSCRSFWSLLAFNSMLCVAGGFPF